MLASSRVMLTVVTNFGPELPSLFKLHKFGQIILKKIIEIVCQQMSNFMAKMHQIRFRLCLRPRSCWGSLQRSPGPLVGFNWAYL